MKLLSIPRALCAALVVLSLNATAQDQDWAKLPAQTAPAAQPAQPAATATTQTNQPAQTVEATPATATAQTADATQPTVAAIPATATAQATDATQPTAIATITPATQSAEVATAAATAQPAQTNQPAQTAEVIPQVSQPTTEAVATATAITNQPVATDQLAVTNQAAQSATNISQAVVATQPALEVTYPVITEPNLVVQTAIPGQFVIDAADLIIYNAKVLTLDSNFNVAQAIAIRSNIILAVGKDKEISPYQGPLTRVIDAQGRTVLPGLYDAHVQSWNAAVSELNAPLPVLDSIAAAQEYIRRQSTNKPAGNWIVLNNLYPTRMREGRLPTMAELDGATTNNPVMWNLGSMVILNSKALEVSKITKNTLEPRGGIIVRDRKTFKPIGILKDSAVALVKLPPPPAEPTPKQRRAALKSLYALYNQQGITSIAEQDTSTNAIDLFRDMSASNELTIRINASRTFDPGTNDMDGAIALLESMTNTPAKKPAYGPTGFGDDWVRIGPLKTVLDGELSMATAYIRTPYGIGPTYKVTELAYRGTLIPDAHVISDICFEAVQRGWQLSTHCSGDAALDFALNCFERVQFQTNVNDRRFIISHNDFQAPHDWVRCVKLGVVASLEPSSLSLDGASLVKTLGESRMTNFLVFKSWFDHNIVVGAGSDHRAGTNAFDSVSPWNPWLGMWVTLTRQTEQGTVINPAECLSREQAIRLYTINNAWNHFEDRKKGSLELGKYADLIMVDTDILNCPVDDIRTTGVLLTMVNGKVVWESRNNWNVVSALRNPEPVPLPQQPQ